MANVLRNFRTNKLFILRPLLTSRTLASVGSDEQIDRSRFALVSLNV